MISMGHICILVNNIEESVQWYNQYFGFELKAHYNLNTKKIAFISLANTKINQIELLEDTSINKSHTEAALHHFCIETSHFDQLYEHLKSENISFESNEPNRTSQGNRTVYLKGINSERIQLLETLFK